MAASMTELANDIAKNTAIVDEYYDKHGLSKPSFDEDGPLDVRIPPTAPDVAAALSRAVAATRELNTLLQGPSSPFRRVLAVNDLFAVQFVSHFGIAEHVPVHGDVSFADLAGAVGVDEQILTRVLRYAFTDWLFRETRPGFVGHTAGSRALKDRPGFAAGARLAMTEGIPASFHIVDALKKYGASQEPIESGWAVANNATKPMFTELALRHPARSATVSEALSARAAQVPIDPLFTVYDFAAANPSAQVVDIGGNDGPVAIALLHHYPHLTCIVQDLSEPIAAGHAKRATLSPDIQSRLTYQVHDMFDDQPVLGADIYFYRAVFHNWPDAYCVRMLKALVPALRPGARVVLNDAVLGAPGEMPADIDRMRRAGDLTMLAFFNSRERTVEDWAALFAQADPRFAFREMRRVGQGAQAYLLAAVMEAVWEP